MLPEVPRTVMTYEPGGVEPLVEIFIVEVAELLPGVTPPGEKEQFIPFGRLEEQAKLTEELNEGPNALTVTVAFTELPWLTVRLDGETLTEKSTPVPVRDVLWVLPLEASSATVNAPVRAPADVGVNVTLTVQ